MTDVVEYGLQVGADALAQIREANPILTEEDAMPQAIAVVSK